MHAIRCHCQCHKNLRACPAVPAGLYSSALASRAAADSPSLGSRPSRVTIPHALGSEGLRPRLSDEDVRSVAVEHWTERRTSPSDRCSYATVSLGHGPQWVPNLSDWRRLEPLPLSMYFVHETSFRHGRRQRHLFRKPPDTVATLILVK